jgi:kynurenine formamidase
LNLITAQARLKASSTVTSGDTISLAIRLDESGPQPAFERRLNPSHVMLETGADVVTGSQPGGVGGTGWSDDMVTMALQAGTHWDALAHCFHDKRMYNDRDCGLVTSGGAQANSIVAACDRIVARGVLADLPAVAGEPLSPGQAITSDMIRHCLERERVEVEPGDVLMLRTGHMQRCYSPQSGWAKFTHHPQPGLDMSALPWIHEAGIAAVAADNWAVEVISPGSDPSALPLPVHAVAIVYMGLYLGEIFALDDLAARCEARKRYTFLLIAAPLPFSRAVGAPVNPIAVL